MEAIQGGIELTGTLYTSAQGDAKDKLAMAEQIYDREQEKFQSEINKELAAKTETSSADLIEKIATAKAEAIATAGTNADTKIAAAVKTNVTDKLGKASGIATLGTDGKLPTTQLPTLKTINGNSIVGSGNISLDLSIYSIVTELPATGANNKIYLVLTAGGGTTGDLYTEYAWINNKWEEFGKYKADVDLTPYMKKADQVQLVKQIGINYSDTTVELDIDYSKADGSDAASDTIGIGAASATRAGVMSKADKVKLDNVNYNATNLTGQAINTGYQINLNGTYIGDNPADNMADRGVVIPNASSLTKGLMNTVQFMKLNAIADNATADKAITIAELDAILV